MCHNFITPLNTGPVCEPNPLLTALQLCIVETFLRDTLNWIKAKLPEASITGVVESSLIEVPPHRNTIRVESKAAVECKITIHERRKRENKVTTDQREYRITYNFEEHQEGLYNYKNVEYGRAQVETRTTIKEDGPYNFPTYDLHEIPPLQINEDEAFRFTKKQFVLFGGISK